MLHIVLHTLPSSWHYGLFSGCTQEMLTDPALEISLFQNELLVWAIVIHLIADWPLQTEWMAVNKANLRHPAAWVHSGIHTCFLLLVFPWSLAVGIGLTHLLIDTRRPVTWWMAKVKQMSPASPGYEDVEMWMDQVFHIIVLAIGVVVLVFSQS